MPTMKRKTHLQNPYTGYFFILPQFLFFAVFILYPVFEGFRISLYKTTAVSNTFVGLENYQILFADPVFLRSVFNTLFLVVVVTACTLFFGMMISVAIFDKKSGYISVIRSFYYLPVIVSTVVMSMVWKFLLNPANGLVSYALKQSGYPGGNVLGDKNLVLWIVAFVTVVASLGQAVIMYVAAMEGVSGEVLEAAEVDGATKFQRTIHILIPLVKPTTLYLAVTNVISILKLFVIIQLLTDGGPNNSSMTMMYYLYRNAFIYDKKNIAAAIGVLMFLLAVLMATPQFKAMSGSTGKRLPRKKNGKGGTTK
ncbi:MAG: sugar ABC transporter permease [Gemmiger sp.]|nr:sugar ABC transporter permease [Gemmiger sp.]